jgi:hypothetical protein
MQKKVIKKQNKTKQKKNKMKYLIRARFVPLFPHNNFPKFRNSSLDDWEAITSSAQTDRSIEKERSTSIGVYNQNTKSFSYFSTYYTIHTLRKCNDIMTLDDKTLLLRFFFSIYFSLGLTLVSHMSVLSLPVYLYIHL